MRSWHLMFLLLALTCLLMVRVSASEEKATVSVDGDVIETDHSDAVEGSEKKIKSRPPPKKRNTKSWEKVDFNKVEKDWEDGDDSELLEHEFEITRRIAEKKRAESQNGQPGFSFNPIKDPETGEERLDPEQMKKLMSMSKSDPMGMAMGMGTSGVMVFVELEPERKKGEGWTKRDVDKLASKWVGLLRSASLDGKVYNTKQDEQKPKKPTLLISVDKAWMAQDVMKFIVQQKETAKVTYNSKEYTKADFPKQYFGDDDDDDD